MARKPKEAPTDKVTWQGFVNVYLNSQEKKQIKENLLSEDHAFIFIQTAAEVGYKFSLTYSEKGGFYSATLYGNTPGGANAGFAMSLRHADACTAISALSFAVGEDGWKSDWSERFTTVGSNDW